VLCCWSFTQKGSVLPFADSLTYSIMSQGVGTKPTYAEIKGGDSNMIAIKSFHPATSVCYDLTSPYIRMLLIYHFILAFVKLSGSHDEPYWVKTICEGSRR